MKVFEHTQKFFTNVMRVLSVNKYIFSNYDYLFLLSLFLNMLIEKNRELLLTLYTKKRIRWRINII